MTQSEILGVITFLVILVVAAIPFGEWMAKVFNGEKNILSFIFRPIERIIYKIGGIDETEEMDWKGYAKALILFNVIGFFAVFALQLLQKFLPLNPQKFGAVHWDLALNTAVSFITNTNWQAYGGENTMSYLTQMLGLAVQNFVSAAVGVAASLALIRGFIRKTTPLLGNFWVDLTRTTLYVLLPVSIITAVIFISQGMPQTFHPYVEAQTLEGAKQVIAVGPVASQIPIKQFGSNGGGFFNVNSAHPYENPTPLTNLLELFGLLFIPVSLVFMFGALLKQRKQGVSIFSAKLVLFLLGLFTILFFETRGNPLLAQLGVNHGLNMEGKEVRVGLVPSALWAQMTTVTSNGSVNAMHDSMMPIPGLVEMFNLATSCVIFGGVGVGLIGMLFYVMVTMFIAGLMIGRTPEYLGKKLEPFEMIMVTIGILASAVTLLALAGTAIATPVGLSSLNNAGPHGLSEIFYAYASGVANNGSAFAGLNANTLFYNLTIAFAMLVGRFTVILPALAIAGSLAKKRITPSSVATFSTTSPLFVALLVSVVLIVGALTFFPALTLGPLLEHLLLHIGRTF